ncbi:MAG: polyhydroxyalkanoic acid system family protein [Thermoguttaceae bacterium]|nr:polyhydroxyalkanoic acid system family protein [Thermoguttaceae bacterium]
MSDIAFSFEYKGTKDDAFKQMKNLEQKARQTYPQYDSCWDITWQDNGGLIDARYMGMDITGQFDIVERDAAGGDVKVTITLPALLSMMKGTLESQIKSEVKKLLG